MEETTFSTKQQTILLVLYFIYQGNSDGSMKPKSIRIYKQRFNVLSITKLEEENKMTTV